MKVDVCRPPAPPRPPAEVVIVLTEQEARDLYSIFGDNNKHIGGVTQWEAYVLLRDKLLAAGIL